jgi:hypothetical protein
LPRPPRTPRSHRGVTSLRRQRAGGRQSPGIATDFCVRHPGEAAVASACAETGLPASPYQIAAMTTVREAR